MKASHDRGGGGGHCFLSSEPSLSNFCRSPSEDDAKIVGLSFAAANGDFPIFVEIPELGFIIAADDANSIEFERRS